MFRDLYNPYTNIFIRYFKKKKYHKNNEILKVVIIIEQ